MNPHAFIPHPLLRNGYLQSILASSKLRTLGQNDMCTSAEKRLLHCRGDVQLLGFYSPQPEGMARGLVILLHGWEGSVDSAYMLTTGRYFFQRGYSIFRLNYRDHGDTHRLNRGLFYAVLLEEVAEAVQQASRFSCGLPVFLAGFSLGGNFVLRILQRLADFPIVKLKHAISISPVLDPEKATQRIDASVLFRNYFLKKWRRSLMQKQHCFPETYDFAEALSMQTVRATTDVLLRRYSPFASTREYFNAYALERNALMNIDTPLTIITAQDDPIIPADDFYALKLHPSTELIIPSYGGHNGFITGLFSGCWYQDRMKVIFKEYVNR